MIKVKDLSIAFTSEKREFIAVDRISFTINQGEFLGIVGESGCGKTVTALSLLRLLPTPPGKISSGEIWYENRDLLAIDIADMQKIRGNRISMIFQEPMTSLSPLQTIGKQLAEGLFIHRPGVSRNDALALAEDWLKRIGIPDPVKTMDAYPFELSGGMQQRVMIAMALIMKPELLIADEPTTALDVTIQAQIIRIIKDMQKELGMAVLFITHDLALIAETCDRVMVMYAGRIVETALNAELFRRPLHPYTEALLRSIPTMRSEKGKLGYIDGQVPSPGSYPAGCRFYDRCTKRMEKCKAQDPVLCEVSPGHCVACWLHNNG